MRIARPTIYERREHLNDEDYKKLFERPMPIKNKKRCNSVKELEATTKINERMTAIQRKFSAKSEMSQSRAACFNFSC
jgi:hypothetical protein